MKDFLGFTRRNLIIYFKDILAIFFSLLTSIIVFVLYLLFLKGTFVDALKATMSGLENFVSGGDVDMLANGILLTGILGTAMITDNRKRQGIRRGQRYLCYAAQKMEDNSLILHGIHIMLIYYDIAYSDCRSCRYQLNGRSALKHWFLYCSLRHDVPGISFLNGFVYADHAVLQNVIYKYCILRHFISSCRICYRCLYSFIPVF